MKRKTSYFSRVLSVFLAVLMCLSVAMMDWSTVLPETYAIGQGAWTVTSWGNVYNTDGDSNCTVTVYFTDGSTNSYSFNGSNSGTQGWSSWSKTGFPYQMNVSHSYKNPDFGCTFYVQVNGSTVMEASWSNTDGADGTNDRRGTNNWSTSTGTRPYLASCGISQGNQSITANNYGGAEKQVYLSAWANDQYGVSYPCSVTWSIPTNKSSLSLTTSSGDSTKVKVPAAYGAGNQTSTVRANIGGNNRDISFYVGNNYYYIDLNGNLDGSDAGNISGYGTANVDVKGTRQATNCTDYYTQWPSGSTYSISNSGASSGKTYISGNASGTVGSSNIDVRLVYKTNATIVINPNTGVFNNTSNSTTYTRYYGQTVSIPNPTKTGWTFTGWSKTGNTVGSISGTTFTFNTKTSGQTEYWTATWSRGMTSAFKYATEAKGAATSTINRSQNFTSPTNTYTVTSPSASEVPVTLSKDDKTWTLKGWSTGSAATWGAASSTAAIGINANHSESATTSTGSFTYWPVYALTTTKFYANYNYYTDEASSYTTIQKNTTVNGDATTGTMAVPAGSDNGSGAEFARYYTKGGIVYELQGWSLTNGGTTVDVPYNSGSATLNVPGAGTPTSTANLTPIELYPVYTRYAVAVKARFHYYTDGGVDNYKETSGMAIEPSLTGEISFPGADQVTTTYTKNGRTYTLVGWNLVENSETYGAFGSKAELTKLTNPTTDYYTYYPVYKTVTKINYHYYTAVSNYIPDGTHDVYSDTLTDNYVTKSAENIGGTSDNINAKYASVAVPAAADVVTTFKKNGVTYQIVGWEARTTSEASDWNSASAAFTLGQSENASVLVTANGAAYDYYPVYKIIKKDVVAQYHYYTASGADDIFNVVFADKAVADTAATVTTAAAYNVNTVYKSTLNDGAVTYTLKGWQQDAASTAYKAFGTTDTVALNDLTATFVPFYPVYETTTTSRYYYYTADGTQTSLTKTTTDLKANNTVPKTTDVEIPETGFASIVLDGRTFRFAGFRKDTTSAVETITATSENHNIRDAEYIYYAIYQNDEIALTYNTTHDGITATPTAATQKLTQYINAGTGNANVNNASAVTFDLNFKDIPVKKGYTFIGWSLSDSELEAADYTANGTIKYTTKISKTMYARFSVNKQNVKFVYYAGSLTDGYTTVTKTVDYDDLLRDDTATNGRYVVTAPTVNKNHEAYVFADDTYHYYFTEWVRSDNKGIYTETAGEQPTAYVATFKNVTEDITIQAHYQGVSHRYEVQEIIKPATCTEDGICVKKCLDCGYVWEDAPIENKGGHSVIVEGYRAPTCVREGSTGFEYCTVCNTVVKEAEVIPATGHDYEYKETVAPTCTSQGYDVYVCNNNNTHVEYRNFVSASGHKPDTEDTSVAATCTAPGKTDKVVCTVCGTVIKDSETTLALGHTPVIDVAVAATCTETGLTEGSHCSVCDKVLVAQKEIAALGHDIQTVEAKEPTCTEIGWTAGNRCSRCDYGTSSETIPALGHDYGDNEARIVDSTCIEAGTSTQYCERCKKDIVTELELADHTPAKVEAKAATCKEVGYGEYTECSVCGKELTKKIETGYGVHSWIVDAKAVAATCTEDGHTESYKCKYCDEKIAYKTIPATGHQYSAEIETVLPTCTENGYRSRECILCHNDNEIKVIPALGHDMTKVEAKKVTCTEDGNVEYYVCSRCEGVIFANAEGTATLNNVVIEHEGHEWVVDTTAGVNGVVAPTCTTQGYTLWICKNEGCTAEPIKADFTDATGHSGGTATCKDKAVCENCGEEYGGYAAHKYETTTTAGTCITKGTSTDKCTVCGYSKPTKETKYGDHDYDFSVTTVPTCCDKGEMTYVCKYCGDTYTAELEATGNHTDEDSDGYCDDCGAVISGSIADHSGTCDKCGKEHGDKVGGIFGYDGLVCKIIAVLRKLFG